MINSEKRFDIYDYIEILLRRKWYVLICFVVVVIGSVLYAAHAPKIYKASTLILVTPQKVPEQIVRPTVTSKIEDRLQTIRQEILSRTRLEQTIKEFQLYAEDTQSLTIEEIVARMRRDIGVEVKKEGYFTISYSGKNPLVVANVTNRLASLFIEENLKLREQQAQGTTEFLEVELNATRAKLEAQEKSITQYKKQFISELPEQRDANLRVVELLQQQLQRISGSLRAAQDRTLVIQKQMNEMKMARAAPLNSEEVAEEEPAVPVLPSISPADGKPSSKSRPKSSGLVQPRPTTASPYELKLDELRKLLVSLQMKYTEKHPDIQLTRKEIADLEGKVRKIEADRRQQEEQERIELARKEEEAERELKEAALLPVPVDSKPRPPKKKKEEPIEANPFYRELEGQLASTDLEITRLKEEEPKVKSRILDYQARIENTPVRELAMTDLSRDYQNTKESYQTLLRKSQEAQQAENLERRQKGEQFKVVDPARVPEKPDKPNVPSLILFGILLGAGSGLGIAFMREQMDRSFQDAADLEATLGLRVIANIPKVKYDRAA